MNRQGLVTMKIQEAEHNRLAVFKRPKEVTK